ncbi:MAG: hypothetical protein ACRC8Y_02000 [Chroococcales cyanobacterium]
MKYANENEIPLIKTGEPDIRPQWAKRLSPHHSNWAMIERVRKTCQQANVNLTDTSVVELKTVALEMERCYLVTVFVDGNQVGSYKY